MKINYNYDENVCHPDSSPRFRQKFDGTAGHKRLVAVGQWDHRPKY